MISEKDFKESLKSLLYLEDSCNTLERTMEYIENDGWFLLDYRYSNGKLNTLKISLTKDWLLEFWNRNGGV